MSAPHLRPVPDVDPDSGEVLEHAACVECVDLRGRLLNLEQDNRRLEKDLRTWRGKYEKAVEDRDAKLRNDKHYPAAIGLIQEWKTECGHPNASEDDPKRVQLALRVVKRYKDQREKLSLVIQHGKHLAFVDPDTGFKYDEFGRLFGSSDEIEARASKFWLWQRKRGGAA
jgi:hypothetical protein